MNPLLAVEILLVTRAGATYERHVQGIAGLLDLALIVHLRGIPVTEGRRALDRGLAGREADLLIGVHDIIDGGLRRPLEVEAALPRAVGVEAEDE